MDACLRDSELDRLSTEELPAAHVAAARRHLQACPRCAQRDRELALERETLLNRLRAAVNEEAPPPLPAQTRSATHNLKTTDPDPTAIAQTPRPSKPADSPKAWSIPADQIPGYSIVREIQAGGQGVVYEAIQQSTKKRVAIKVVREGPFADPENRARLERGMRILAQIDHPNIVGIIDSGTVAGTFYYVMDYIEGQALDQYAARLVAIDPRAGSTTFKQHRLGTESLLKLMIKICEVVHAAHLRGVVHRDLKPGNIRVDRNGQPHLLDFDLAKIVMGDMVDDPQAEARTMTGQFLGSLPWASPEQAEGNPAKIDVRSDVYSLGVILYQLLTGKFPYEVKGNLRDVLDSILRAPPIKPSSIQRYINDEVEIIILKCLAKERDRRYQSAGALAEDLRRYLGGEPILAKRASTMYILRKLALRHRVATTALVAMVVTLLSTTYISFFAYRQARDAWAERDRQAREATALAKTYTDMAVKTKNNFFEAQFGWFLLEWRSGRIPSAKQIRDETPRSSPAFAAMEFLLDPTQQEESFQAKLPADYDAFGHFVVGERHYKAKRYDAAKQEYAEIARVGRRSLIDNLAKARLQELSQIESASKSPERKM